MNDWSEDNFLERLTPQLRQKLGGADSPCPDAEALCAVLDGEARQPERDAVVAHLSQCAACAYLGTRLVRFDNEGPTESEAAWNLTRTRLDNWLEGFLHSEAARPGSARSGGPSWRFFSWVAIRGFLTSMKIVWASSVVLALGLIVDGALVLKYRVAHMPQVQMAARPTVPPKPPGMSTGNRKTSPPGESLPKVGNNLSPNTETTTGPGAGAPSFPPASADHNLPTETAQATTPSPQNSTPRVVVGAEEPSTPRNAAAGASTSRPPTLWLDPASRLFIVVSAIHIEPDGSLQFHGILLLPVAQPERVLLDRGTEVIGVGKISQGQTSIAVTDLVVQGVRYTLKEGSGQMNAETPGAGGKVDFERSQNLDMWPTDTAAYEKVSGPTGQPGPQK